MQKTFRTRSEQQQNLFSIFTRARTHTLISIRLETLQCNQICDENIKYVSMSLLRYSYHTRPNTENF
jgi:hypothetical protein